MCEMSNLYEIWYFYILLISKNIFLRKKTPSSGVSHEISVVILSKQIMQIDIIKSVLRLCFNYILQVSIKEILNNDSNFVIILQLEFIFAAPSIISTYNKSCFLL